VGHFEKWELAFVPFGVMEKKEKKVKQVSMLDKTLDPILQSNPFSNRVSLYNSNKIHSHKLLHYTRKHSYQFGLGIIESFPKFSYQSILILGLVLFFG